MASAASGDPTRDPSSKFYENEMDRQSDNYRPPVDDALRVNGLTFSESVALRQATNNPYGLPTRATNVVARDFDPQNQWDPDALGGLGDSEEGPFKVAGASEFTGSPRGRGQAPAPTLTAADRRQQVDTLNKQSATLANAAQWARANGMNAAADDYQQKANAAYYAAFNAAKEASDITAAGQASMLQPITQFVPAPGWSYLGANSSGIDINRRGLLTPDYQALGVGSLSGSGGLARNNYDGTVYMFGGVTQGNPRSISFKPSASGTFAWIFGAKDATAVNQFLAGDSNQTFVSIPTPWPVNFFGAVTHSYGGAYALELGVGQRGQFSYGVTPISHSTIVYDPNKR